MCVYFLIFHYLSNQIDIFNLFIIASQKESISSVQNVSIKILRIDVDNNIYKHLDNQFLFKI